MLSVRFRIRIRVRIRIRIRVRLGLGLGLGLGCVGCSKVIYHLYLCVHSYTHTKYHQQSTLIKRPRYLW